jgi:hypothetical protein
MPKYPSRRKAEECSRGGREATSVGPVIEGAWSKARRQRRAPKVRFGSGTRIRCPRDPTFATIGVRTAGKRLPSIEQIEAELGSDAQ